MSTETKANTDIEKAQQWKLKDEDIDRARLLLGIYVAEEGDSYITEASPTSMRNYANGIGDDNPLFCDPEYGARTRWGAQIAPPSMSEVIARSMYGDPLPADLAKATKGVFRGVHVFVSGTEKFFYRPIYSGDSLHIFSGEEDVVVKPSQFSDRTVTRFMGRVRVNQKGEVVFSQRLRSILAERSVAVKKGKYMKIEPTVYTDEDLAKIDEIYAKEQRRGAEPRYFEDVEVGEALPDMVKGPLLVTHVIAYHGGGYGMRDFGLFGSRLWHKNRKRIPPFYIKNDQGIPDVAQRVHWDIEWAKAIGNPMPYDYSAMREAWFNHYLTDWAGDDGWVYRQYDEMRKFNYIGDTQFLKGQVVAKRVEDDRFYVDLVVEMTNQRGEKTSLGEATVLLPSREHGPVLLPEPPTDLARRAARMFVRHNQLKPQMKAAGS